MVCEYPKVIFRDVIKFCDEHKAQPHTLLVPYVI